MKKKIFYLIQIQVKTKNAQSTEDLEEDHAENDESQTSDTDLINDKQQETKLPLNQTFIRNLKNKCHKMNFGRKFKMGNFTLCYYCNKINKLFWFQIQANQSVYT